MQQAVLVAALMVGACGARDVHTVMPGATVDETAATVVLHFTHAVDNAHVSINGVAVARDAHTQEIVVGGIPSGEAMIMLAADGVPEKAFVVNLQPGQRMVIPLSAADTSVGRTLLQALLSAAVYAMYLGVAASL